MLFSTNSFNHLSLATHYLTRRQVDLVPNQQLGSARGSSVQVKFLKPLGGEGMGWDGVGWGGMGCDGMGWEGMG